MLLLQHAVIFCIYFESCLVIAQIVVIVLKDKIADSFAKLQLLNHEIVIIILLRKSPLFSNATLISQKKSETAQLYTFICVHPANFLMKSLQFFLE